MTSKQGPWDVYQPTPDDRWDPGKVAHLHRRAGFGATWAELVRDRKDGPTRSVDRLIEPRRMTTEERKILDDLRKGVVDSKDTDRLKAWWLYRVLWDPDPLREKLTLFWHSQFATSNRKVESIPQMLQQNDLLRRHALGSFADLLMGMIADPAMLVWLDGAGSKKEKPNENFARASFWSCSRWASASTRRKTSAPPPAPSPAGRCKATGPTSTRRSTTAVTRRSSTGPAPGSPPTSCASRWSNRPVPSGCAANCTASSSAKTSSRRPS
jgi:hypothetical protein